jgi:hypothetical protein
MTKALLSFVVFCLFVVPSASGANVENTQVLTAHSGMTTLSSGLNTTGPGSSGTVTLCVPSLVLSQTGSANDGQTIASQKIAASLGQTGAVVTQGAGTMTSLQTLDVQTLDIGGPTPSSGQYQIAKEDGDAQQGENLWVIGIQSIDKGPGGAAAGLGTDAANIGLLQNSTSPGTNATGSVEILALPMSHLSGGPNAEGQVTTDLNIIIGHFQDISQSSVPNE